MLDDSLIHDALDGSILSRLDSSQASMQASRKREVASRISHIAELLSKCAVSLGPLRQPDDAGDGALAFVKEMR